MKTLSRTRMTCVSGPGSWSRHTESPPHRRTHNQSQNQRKCWSWTSTSSSTSSWSTKTSTGKNWSSCADRILTMGMTRLRMNWPRSRETRTRHIRSVLAERTTATSFRLKPRGFTRVTCLSCSCWRPSFHLYRVREPCKNSGVESPKFNCTDNLFLFFHLTFSKTSTFVDAMRHMMSMNTSWYGEYIRPKNFTY